MRFTLRIACLTMACTGFWTSQATAQLCTTGCDWALPDIAHWTFDDVSIGDALDSSGNGNTAIWAGNAGANVPAPGIIGGGSQTNDENGGNGQEHYRVALPQMDGASGLTISLWFNQNVENNNNSTYNGLFMVRDLVSSFGGGGENWGIALENNSTPRHIDWRLDGAAGPEDDLIEGDLQDRWDHVAYTWDGTDQGDGMGERALFLNGVELHRIDAPMGSITTSGTWRIGDDACCGNREFTGTLDDLGVWTTALSATDISQIYAAATADPQQSIGLDKILPPLQGDVDLDDDVDIIDFNAIRDNFFTESGAPRADGDLTGNEAVDWADFRQWKDNFPTPGAGSGAGATPEPAAGMLLAISLLSLGFTRRRES